MKGSKNGKTNPPAVDPDLLAELFDGDEYDPRERYDIVSSLELGALVAAVTGLGGVVSFYSVLADNSLCFTVGLGDRRRRYTISIDDLAGDLLSGISNTYKQAWVKRHPGDLSALQPVPKGKRGS